MAGDEARMSEMQLAFSGIVLVFGLVSVAVVSFRSITVDSLYCGRALSVALHGVAWRGVAPAPGQPADWAQLCGRSAWQAVLPPASMAVAALIWFGFALTRTLRASRAGQVDRASASPR